MDHLVQLLREQIIYFYLDVRRGLDYERTEETEAIVRDLSRTLDAMISVVDRLSVYRKEKKK